MSQPWTWTTPRGRDGVRFDPARGTLEWWSEEAWRSGVPAYAQQDGEIVKEQLAPDFLRDGPPKYSGGHLSSCSPTILAEVQGVAEAWVRGGASLAAGADLAALDAKGATALDRATRANNSATVALLRSADASQSAPLAELVRSWPSRVHWDTLPNVADAATELAAVLSWLDGIARVLVDRPPIILPGPDALASLVPGDVWSHTASVVLGEGPGALRVEGTWHAHDRGGVRKTFRSLRVVGLALPQGWGLEVGLGRHLVVRTTFPERLRAGVEASVGVGPQRPEGPGVASFSRDLPSGLRRDATAALGGIVSWLDEVVRVLVDRPPLVPPTRDALASLRTRAGWGDQHCGLVIGEGPGRLSILLEWSACDGSSGPTTSVMGFGVSCLDLPPACVVYLSLGGRGELGPVVRLDVTAPEALWPALDVRIGAGPAS